MWIKDWWNRMLKKFKKEDSIPEAENVMELKPEEAPEPVPERKTSDEMIVTMAESARKGQAGSAQEPADQQVRAQEEPGEICDPEGTAEICDPEGTEEPEVEPEEICDPEESVDPEDPYGVEGQAGPDPSEEIAWREAEDDEEEDVDEEC